MDSEFYINIANIFAIVSVPLGIVIGGMLTKMRSDIAVVKKLLEERTNEETRTRNNISKLFERVNNLEVKLAEGKSK